MTLEELEAIILPYTTKKMVSASMNTGSTSTRSGIPKNMAG